MYKKKDGETEMESPGEVAIGFLGRTTTHGLPSIRRGGLIKRLIWSSVFLLSISGFLAHLYAISSWYASYAVDTRTQFQYSPELDFPSVTVCNMNPVKLSSMMQSPRLSSLMEKWGVNVMNRRRRKREVVQDGDLGSADAGGGEVGYKDKDKEINTNAQVIQQKSNVGLDGADGVKASDKDKGIESQTYTPGKQQGQGVGLDRDNAVTIRKNNGKKGNVSECEEHNKDYGTKIVRTKMENMKGSAEESLFNEDAANENKKFGKTLQEALANINTNRTTSIIQQQVHEQMTLLRRYRRDTEDTTVDDNPDDDFCVTWSDDKTKCYWLAAPLALFYKTGQIMCQMDGGRMVTIQREEDYTNIQQVFGSNVPAADPRIFLNLHYVVAFKTFRWDKTEVMSWTSWAEGYPKPSVNACVTSKVKVSYSWQSISCGISSAYCVCEKIFGDGEGGGSASTGDPTSSTNTVNETTIAYTDDVDTTVSFEDIATTPPTIFIPTKEEPVITSTQPDVTTSKETTNDDQTTEDTLRDSFTSQEPPLPIPGPGSVFPDRPPLRESFMFENQVIEYLADVSPDVKKALGYNFDEFVLDCRFDGKDCMEDGFGSFFDAVHGNCFVFNSGWKNTSTKKYLTYQAGRSHGLELVVNIEQEEYIPNLIDGAGAVVVVHPLQRMPFPEDEGVLAMPGQVTSVGITQVKIDRLDGNYGNCTRIRNDKTRNVFAEEHNVHYSTNACFKTCYQYHVINQCGCADPQYPFKGQAFSNISDNVMACNSQNVREEDCVYNITLQYNTDKLDCDCSNTCTDTFYKHSVSTTRWPAQVFEDDILEKYASKISYKNSDGKDAFRSNLLKVEIYFNQLNFKYIQEKPKYTLYQYLSDVGAILGLWLGMSVISIFEFVQLIIDMCCPGPRQQQQQPQHPRRRSFLESADDLRRSSFDWSKSQINGMLKSLRIVTVAQRKDISKPTPKGSNVVVSAHALGGEEVWPLPAVESPTLASHLLATQNPAIKLSHL